MFFSSVGWVEIRDLSDQPTKGKLAALSWDLIFMFLSFVGLGRVCERTDQPTWGKPPALSWDLIFMFLSSFRLIVVFGPAYRVALSWTNAGNGLKGSQP